MWFLDRLSFFSHFKNVKTTASDPIFYIQNLRGIKRFKPLSDKCNVSNDKSLVRAPGNYAFYGENYCCKEPGVYRFWSYGCQPEQFVVFGGCSYENAIYMSYLSIRGNADDNLSIRKIEKKAKCGLVCLTCGPLAGFVKKLMTSNGMEVRVVHTFTRSRFKGYNDSHTLLEVWSKEAEKYVLVDVDRKALFFRKNTPLSFFDVYQIVQSNKTFEVRTFSKLTLIDWGGFSCKKNGNSFAFFELFNYGEDSGLERMIERLFGVPMICKDGVPHFLTSDAELKSFFCKKYKRCVFPDNEGFRKLFY